MRIVKSIAEVSKPGFGHWLQAESARGRLTLGSRKLQKIMRRAYQRPLASDLADSSQQKLAKSSPLLDLTEHGFDCLFPQPVATTVPTPTKLLPHRVGVGAQLDLSFYRRRRLPMFLTARGNVAVDMTPSELLEIVFRTIPCIGRQFPSLSFCVLFDLGYHHRELRCVGGVVGQRLSYNHLAIGIHNGLSVVTLNKPVGAFHDPAFWIGEVGLSRILGCPWLVLARATRTGGFFLFSLLGCLRLGFQASAGLFDLFQPKLFVPHPVGQFLSAQIGSLVLIVPGIAGFSLA